LKGRGPEGRIDNDVTIFPRAKEYVSRIEKKIILIGGEELAQLMIDHGIGVTEVRTYSLRKMDLDYFGEE
jgi:restriction system protein